MVGAAARGAWPEWRVFDAVSARRDIALRRISMRTTTFDFTPLFRTAVGFDRLTRTLDAAARLDDGALSYPPYNIERLDEDNYRVTMALAGFSGDDVEVVLHQDTLTVKSKAVAEKENGKTYLHRGIASRGFERRFQLADHIVVKGVELENGLLTIDLAREIPEEMKPRTIPIRTAA
jgi:molecular chaperone IbpA